jgi:flagellar hook assembly protein FlgD
VVLPDMTDAQGHSRQLVVTAGKDQNIYIADRTNMGKYNPNSNNALYQEIASAFTSTNNASPNPDGGDGGCWSMAAYFNGSLYFGPVDGPITEFPFQNALLQNATSVSPTIYTYPGATPSISANGSSNGIVWTSELVGATNSGASVNAGGGTLHAYAATNLGEELYNSNQATNDYIPFGQKFTPPTVASARVYLTVNKAVNVYGLLDTSTLTPIQKWRNTNFGNPSNVGAGANSACPAGDGVPNLVKYALGLNPFTHVSSNQFGIAAVQQSGGQSYLTLNINRAANPVDVSYIEQISTNLKSWISIATNTTTLTNTPTQLVISDSAPVGSGTNAFLRLLVTPTCP